MAIVLRGGAYKDFDPNKLLAKELAVILEGDPRASNGRSLYVCYKPGIVKQIATYEDMVEFLKASMSDTSEQIAEELARQLTENLLSATNAANNAAEAANAEVQTISELKTQIQEEESKRVLAETKRQQDTTNAINAAENAAEAANEAAEVANTAAQEGKNYEGVLESFPETGKAGISYIDIETNTTYRWDAITGTYIPIGGNGAGDLSVVSDEYASDKNYLAGDYAIRDNVLYRFISDKAAGEWDEAVVEPTNVGREFQDLNAKTTFSTEEQVIGTWIDGKPLYRKVISTTANWSAVNQTIPHGISNFGHVINLTVFLGSYLLPYFSNGAAMTYVSTVNKNAIAVINSATWLEYRLVAIIEYTKAEL